MSRTDRWWWSEAKAEILDEEGETIARVVSDSAADPNDGDGPIMAAARDLLYAAEAFLGAFGGDIPDWLQEEADTLHDAIIKARS